MELWTGLYLVSLLTIARCLLVSSYTVHLNKLSFENAQNYCEPGSFLTNIPNEKEMEKILKTIWDMNSKNATSFWIGLKRNKGTCLQKNLPLRGFHWTVDNSTQSDIKTWKTEPSGSCASLRCGLLSVEYSNSGTKTYWFVDASCRHEYPFICKRNKLACPRPEILGSRDMIEPKNDPYTRQIYCRSGPRFNLTCSKDLVWTVAGHENVDISQLCLGCNKGYRRDASGNCADVNECEESKPCEQECQNTEGSYKCLCSYNDDGICNEPSQSPTTTLKNRDKSVLTQPTSPPDDVRTNKTAVHTDESAGDISNIVVPVIIALLIFIVLLVIVAAIVKGCLRRRSIKLAQRKAEAVALNGSSSMEKVNEKEET
ncbi:complement component C1q receptor-like protein [Labeo rohita]|uniref:Complement component C1q receptor-like protein n=2 Tax=Labeo rohita TaxID=84645 RepID=A0A498N3N0_LABRO|nr:C-type lectin domain family 14 member A [Labeo rohita]KAI2654164.1 Complement component C1q receptor [Labeo rohita]RXN27371.1 complement component C1q receptor-like protein [Labeo rohita]